MRKAFRVVAVGGAICAIALIAPVSSAQPRPSATTGDTNYAEFDSLVSLGMNGPLKLTRDQAVASASSTASRAEFRRLALEKLGTSLVGGYYDSATNVSHVWVTTDDAASVVSDLAAESSTPVEVTAGYADRKVLDDLATRINAEIAKIAPDQSSGVVFGAGVDNATGRVLVTYADESLRAMVERAVDSKDLVDWQLSTEEFHTNSCVSRSACGTPARAGIIIGEDVDGAGPGSAQQDCSLGFTSSATDGSKWVLTAGHCISDDVQQTLCPPAGAGQVWGHGQQYFGNARCWTFNNAASVDVARIRVQNTYWGTGGWIYYDPAPNSPVAVNYSIHFNVEMVPGDYVCLAAWHSAAPNDCGYVGTVVGGYQSASLQSCSGDSGGGWYYPGGGTRIAYGIQHAVSGSGCHTTSGRSIFTGLPTVNAFFDSTASAVIRVEQQ